jgi:hypothetical protein
LLTIAVTVAVGLVTTSGFTPAHVSPLTKQEQQCLATLVGKAAAKKMAAPFKAGTETIGTSDLALYAADHHPPS